MDWLNLILDVAALLLWLNWRAVVQAPKHRPAHTSLVWTLQAATARGSRGWHSLAGLLGLLGGRSLLYSQLGPALSWTATVNVGAVTIPFRSDRWERMVVFSGFSFLVLLACFYAGLLLLSAVNRRAAESDRWQQAVAAHLGPVARAPTWLKLLIPGLGCAVAWIPVLLLLAGLGILPRPFSILHLLEQALVLGLCIYLAWKLVLGLVLALFLLNSHFYFGDSSLWRFVSLTGQNLLRPLAGARLHVGKFEATPLLAIAAVFLTAEFAANGLAWLFRQLPL